MKKILILLICFYFVTLGSALAEIELPIYMLELGTELFYFRYKEPRVMREKGMMYGIIAEVKK